MSSFAVLSILAAMFDNCLIKILQSDAKSREDKDGVKQNFVGRMAADPQKTGLFRSEKHRKEVKINPAEEGNFPTSFYDLWLVIFIIGLALLELGNFY